MLLLVRRPRVDLPPEWLARLAALESTAQATQLAVAKNDGAMDALANQLAGFTQATQHTLESLRHAVDERLAQAVAESRNGRAELLAAFGVFEARLEQRQTALDASLAQRFDGLQQAVASRLEESSKALLAHLAQGQADSAAARKELSDTLVGFRTELTATTGALAAESVKSREAMGESAVLFEKRIQERFEALQAATRLTLDSLKGDIQAQLGTMSTALKDQLEANGTQIKNQFSVLQDAVSQQLAGLVQGSQHNAEQVDQPSECHHGLVDIHCLLLGWLEICQAAAMACCLVHAIIRAVSITPALCPISRPSRSSRRAGMPRMPKRAETLGA